MLQERPGYREAVVTLCTSASLQVTGGSMWTTVNAVHTTCRLQIVPGYMAHKIMPN